MTQLEDKYNEQDANYIKRRQKQIKNVRYMVYTFVVGISLLIFQPIFSTSVDKVRWAWAAKKMTSMSAGNPINNITKGRGEGGLLNEIDTLDASIIQIQEQIKAVDATLAIVKHLDNEQKQNTIALCLNTEQCSGVPASLTPHLTLLRNYIILDRLQWDWEKMDFDQKMVLKSISEFLLKSPWGIVNGELQSINFTAPAVVDANLRLYKLSFNLSVDFSNKELLLAFLENVDTKMDFNIPILYAIDNVSYDAMSYEDPQTVMIGMSAYYYVWEKKIITQEHAAADGKDEWDLGDLAELINAGDSGNTVLPDQQPTKSEPSELPIQPSVPTDTTPIKAVPTPVEQPSAPQQSVKNTSPTGTTGIQKTTTQKTTTQIPATQKTTTQKPATQKTTTQKPATPKASDQP